MALWQRETYPAISRQDKWDEGEYLLLARVGRSRQCGVWNDVGAKRQPPVKSVPGQRQSTSATSIVGPSVQRCQSWEAVEHVHYCSDKR